MTDVQVENLVVSFCLPSAVDLPALAGIMADAKYNPEELPAIVIQLSKPRCMVTVFATGNTVITGPKSMEDVDSIVKMVLDRLTVVGMQVQQPPTVVVQNVTVSTHLHRPLDLSFLATSLHTEPFDPASFPGLVYRGENPNTVLLLFDSGKIICNSGSLSEATVAVEKVVEKLVTFGIRKEEDVCRK
ncbi:MAG: hypothetical protein JXA00_00635 [Candidatus Thermoplasmatota archaeon]|nr:hypothetical protein [Candidatus Thermoplasmatota archaeon]